VFDLDGTLVDTMTSAPMAYARTITSLGGPELSVDEVVAAWHVGPAPVVLAHVLRRAVSPDDVECYYGHVEAAVAAVTPFPGVRQMLDALDQQGYRLGVFTAATRRAAHLVLAAAGLDRYFPTVIGGDDVDQPKPAPRGLRIACQELGVRVAAAAYVGDAETDLQCAEAAGALGIHARWGAPPVTIAGARLVAQHPNDVVGLLSRPDPARRR
jgi:HAD superfamily hydrolase (TIGR01509 family)